jgi:hypothetical protein
MEIKTEFTLGGLDYSYTLPTKYTWNELENRGFSFGENWRVPYRDELTILFDHAKESRDGLNLWSASALAYNRDAAWYFDFGRGCPRINGRINPLGVRLVREIG